MVFCNGIIWGKNGQLLRLVDTCRELTFWNRKFLAPLSYSVFTQLTAQVVVLTTVAPGAPWPTISEFTPTSLVPIHNV